MPTKISAQQVRQWIEANYPPEIRNPPKRLHHSDTKVWYQKLSRKGWLCPGWPKEFGGMGLSPGKQLIMLEEKERHGCARFNGMGVTMLGPLLIRYGTKEQQDYYLPKILHRRAHLVPGLLASRTPVPISPACAPRRCWTATSGW